MEEGEVKEDGADGGVVPRVGGEEAKEGEESIEWVGQQHGAEEGDRSGGERGEVVEDSGEEVQVGLEGGFDDGGAECASEVDVSGR